MRRRLLDLRERLHTLRVLRREYFRIWHRYTFNTPQARTARRRVATRVLTFIAALLLVGVVLRGYQYPWTGFGPVGGEGISIRPQKTLWDWMQLLLMPLVLAIIAFLFTRAQRDRDTKLSSLQRGADALHNYLDYMTRLLVEQDLTDDSLIERASRVAKARTTSLLDQLTGTQKGHLLRFIADSGLLDREGPFLSLERANFQATELEPGLYRNCRLHGVNLDRAVLEHCSFDESDLASSTIMDARLEGADFYKSNMDYVLLTRSDL